MNRLDSYSPLGYSLAGVVLEVGKGAEEFSVGQLVACAGNEFALHAEINWVPTNLCVAVPDGVSPQLAAFATVGSIALQGVRQARRRKSVTPRASSAWAWSGSWSCSCSWPPGVRVVGLDPDEDRCRLAEKAGALLCAAPTDDGVAAIEQALAKASGGLGADRIFLVAGGSSNQPVELAARLARDRATVVDIGKCKLDLPWNDYYEKELDLRFSRSYGPGRYDATYEIDGSRLPGRLRALDRATQPALLRQCAWPGRKSTPNRSSPGSSRLAEAPSVYEQLSDGVPAGCGLPLRVRRPRGRRGCRGPNDPGPDAARAPSGRGATSPRAVVSQGVRHGGARPDRLHRCRQLRLVDAASAPRRRPAGLIWCGSPPAGRSRPSTRSESSASRNAGTDADAVIEDPSTRRRLHRHPTQLTRRPCLSRPRGRKGGLRREAPGPLG